MSVAVPHDHDLICEAAEREAFVLVEACGAQAASDELLSRLDQALSELPESEAEKNAEVLDILRAALDEAKCINAELVRVVDTESDILAARVDETLHHLQADQAGVDLQRNLDLAQQLIASAKSANELLEAAKLALISSPLSDVGMFHPEQPRRPEIVIDPRAFKRQRH